jgi:hypothetical protein
MGNLSRQVEQNSALSPAQKIYEVARLRINSPQTDRIYAMVSEGLAPHFQLRSNPHSIVASKSEGPSIATSDPSTPTENLTNFARGLYHEHYRK